MKKFVYIAASLLVILALVSFFYQEKREFPSINNIRGCDSNRFPTLTHYPTDMDKVESIEPPLMEISGNLKGHSYINVTERVPVYAPADAKITDGVKYRENLGGRGDLDQYLLHFEVSCETFYFFDHIINPPEKIAEAFPGPAKKTTHTQRVNNVEIEAGELIGYSAGQGQHNFDFGMVNRTEMTSVSGSGKYLDSPKYNNATCPYKYFEPGKKEVLSNLLMYSATADLNVIDNICEDI